MPIYEYQCGQCGHSLEIIQKLSDPVLTECPQCRQGALRKLVSAPSFRLKGGGWYETDFKQTGRKHLADGGDAPDKSAAGSKEASSAAAPDADKPASKPADKKSTEASKTPTSPAASTPSKTATGKSA